MPDEGAGKGAALFGAVLFTPGDRPERFEKGWQASRGSLILDLEDGVGPDRKAFARDAVAEWIGSGRRALVRVNAPGTVAFQEDVRRLSGLALPAILIPKVDSPADVEAVSGSWPGASIYPLIESPLGLRNLEAIARQAGVVQVCLGALDLHAACAMSFPQPGFIDYCRMQLVLASRIADIAGPVDSPYPGFKDSAAVASDALAAARLGFSAKLCIHPTQLDVVDAAFRPSEDEVQWAREVVVASESGGVATVRGAMVDAPVLASARRILDRTRRPSD